jgi:SAM-dependent methyltransferase
MGGRYYDKAEAEQDRLLREAAQRLRRLDRLCLQFGLTRRVLDVGCASGYFIKQAVDDGWQATGIDRSKTLAQRARDYAATQVIDGILEDMNLADSPYPVVTAWEVVEHVRDPNAFFAALAKNTAPGGLLALSTPLANGLPARVLGTKFPMLAPPEHLSLFTRRSINFLASGCGFEEVSYRSFSNLGPSSLASGFARLFLRRNINEVSGTSRAACNLAGLILAWAPMAVDRAGWGSEMEIIFRRKPQ